MSHIHELQFVEKGGVQCSTLGCHVYYSEEHIIQILERLANEYASQHSVERTFANSESPDELGMEIDEPWTESP